MADRRGTKPVTAVPEVPAPAPPVTLRLFLQAWGLVAVAVLITGFAGALVALGSLPSSDFIALVTPLAAVLGVVAVARGTADSGGQGTVKAAVPAVPAMRPAEPPLLGAPSPGEAPAATAPRRQRGARRP
jgi:hypothetical protein